MSMLIKTTLWAVIYLFLITGAQPQPPADQQAQANELL